MAIDTSGLPFPKGETRKKTKARDKRRERVVVADVRGEVVGRDGYCRLYWLHDAIRQAIAEVLGSCSGKSEWAHFGEHKRSKTRGKSADERHTKAGSLMLCKFHHGEYDGNRMGIDALTLNGCDGPLRFMRTGQSWEEPK